MAVFFFFFFFSFVLSNQRDQMCLNSSVRVRLKKSGKVREFCQGM